MLIHGTKIVKKKLGWVADFCPLCRVPQSFQLSRIGLASHIYFISLGSGKCMRHEIECASCGLRLISDPARYLNPERRPEADISVLAAKTFPTLAEVYADQLREAYALRTDPHSVTSERRETLLLETFSYLNGLVEERYKGDTQLDRYSGLGCLGTILIPIVMLIVAVNFKLSGKTEDAFFGTGVVLFVCVLLYTLVQLFIGPRRYVRRKIVPMLARALTPLSPTREQLQACLDRCKATGMKIGKIVRIDHLLAALGNEQGLR